MASRVERMARRWLLRVALLGTISFAVYSSLSSWYYPEQANRQKGASTAQGGDLIGNKQNVGQAERGNAIVVAKMRSESTSWLGRVLPGWEPNIYVVDGAALIDDAKLRIPKNKGREGMVYLR
jgi:hypothetical protein